MGYRDIEYDDIIHFGIPGMRWKKRKKQSADQVDSDDSSEEHRKLVANKTRSAKALTDQELQEVIKRANLEKQYAEITKSKKSKTTAYIEDVLTKSSKQVLTTFVTKEMTKSLEKAMAKAAKKAL